MGKGDTMEAYELICNTFFWIRDLYEVETLLNF